MLQVEIAEVGPSAGAGEAPQGGQSTMWTNRNYPCSRFPSTGISSLIRSLILLLLWHLNFLRNARSPVCGIFALRKAVSSNTII